MKRMSGLIGRAGSTLTLAVLVGSSCWAASTDKSDKHPDLSGFWMLDMRASQNQDKELMSKIAPNTAVINDTGAPELSAGDYGGLKLKPEALAQAKKWDAHEQMNVSKVCEAPSIVYAMQGPFPMEIYQGTKLIVMKMEYYDQVRIIFMDGRPHPPASAPHSKVGHSVGHWEGNILVVDTTNLEASTFTNNGADHSENIHVIERFKLSPDGKTLMATQEYEDPDTLYNRGARFIAWRLVPGQYVNPYDCDPSWALEVSK